MNVDLHANQLHTVSICSGGGGLDLGLRLAVPAARTVAYVEIEAYACDILVSRMEEGNLDAAPLFSDLKTFDGPRFRGIVDCLIGGYPCQPFSVAGKMRGAADPRHLWPYIGGQRPDQGNLIRDLGYPPVLFFENVANHLQIGFADVARDLQGMDYEVAAGVFTAEEVGSTHRRERDSSFWRSPDAYSRGGAQDAEKRRAGGHSVNLQDQVYSWPTPNVPNGGRSIAHAEMHGRTALHNGKKVQVGLEAAAKTWSTPRASDAEKGGPNQSFSSGGTPLPSQAVQWGTPTSRDWKDGSNPSENVPTNSLLGRQAPRMMQRGNVSSNTGRTSRLQLNPTFVEWLMGWPPEWTVSGCWATASSPHKPLTPSPASQQTLKAA